MQVQSAAVITYGNHHVASLLAGSQDNVTLGRFAGILALLGRFQTVIHGIAQQVGQRVLNLFQHPFIQFRLAAGDSQRNLFALFTGQIAHHAAKRSSNG